jgi:hypothetical protein
MLGTILIFWFGDLFFGTPAKVSDRAIKRDGLKIVTVLKAS